jgi:hypothetical protein
MGETILERDFRDAFSRSDGLCRAHLVLALERARTGEAADALWQAEKGIWRNLEADLSELIRKSDYRFMAEPKGRRGQKLAPCPGSHQRRGTAAPRVHHIHA